MDISNITNVTTFIDWCDYLGTFAFAISGIRLAAAKGFDWFGAYVVGLVTAVGGGTTRDLMLNLTPFWLLQPSYLIITGLALAFTIALRKQIVRINHTLFFFDSVGLGLFVVVGIAKSFDAGFSWWVALVMGTITGSFGGMIRDILINEVPLIFRKDFYALACLCGGICYILLMYLTDISLPVIQFLCALSVVLLRLMSVLFHISVPVFTPSEGEIE
ncbi:trimeric intracellular cation channel family protein [Porphyromonas sp. COT-239 OH1446]|uniref:trimeric intracellular cation channel family protein n=1 Tax=Porphyromonas sp. COT-239 OH1446 TaxID=1515613 RepID=UPI00052BD2B2|nr:trimeric intracellular cation channel family protein [Porphyromonas sp. COT-239 OH1446]KGN69322.1 membrane protein [Porphyromonas sp. COT-239 OH1446]